MFLLSKPSDDEVRRFLQRAAGSDFSYSAVGATRDGNAPPGFHVDHNRAVLGSGGNAFATAKDAVRRWQMFAIPQTQLCWPDAPIVAGTTVAVRFRHFGFWSINAARIVYVINEAGAVERFGFAYGTLADHAESGEERFSVEWDHTSDAVTYDLFAFSRPQLPLVKLGKPLARRLQLRFIRESKAAMARAVRS